MTQENRTRKGRGFFRLELDHGGWFAGLVPTRGKAVSLRWAVCCQAQPARRGLPRRRGRCHRRRDPASSFAVFLRSCASWPVRAGVSRKNNSGSPRRCSFGWLTRAGRASKLARSIRHALVRLASPPMPESTRLSNPRPTRCRSRSHRCISRSHHPCAGWPARTSGGVGCLCRHCWPACPWPRCLPTLHPAPAWPTTS